MVPAREPPGLARRLDDPRMLLVRLSALREAAPDRGEERGRDHERPGVDEERRVGAERRADRRRARRRPRASCPRASRSARSPRGGPRDRRGSAWPPSRRGRTGPRRPPARAAGRTRARSSPARPGGTPRRSPARTTSQTIISFRRSSRSARWPPIGDARKNADSCARIARPVQGLVRRREDRAVDRDPQEPVAAQRDRRREEQRTEVAVPSQAARSSGTPRPARAPTSRYRTIGPIQRPDRRNVTGSRNRTATNASRRRLDATR